jgi:hypothetical protein
MSMFFISEEVNKQGDYYRIGGVDRYTKDDRMV